MARQRLENEEAGHPEPRHERVDYAYYLKGLALYNRGRGLFENFAPRQFHNIDQTQLQEAFRAFEEVVTRFPNSRYYEDARQRMVYLRNKRAEHELGVASYYFRRGAYAGTVTRIKFLIENYDGAPVVSDALVLLVQAYRKLGMNDLASDTLSILAANHPDHPQLPELNALESG